VLAAVLGPGEVAVWPAQPLASTASTTVTAKRKTRGLKTADMMSLPAVLNSERRVPRNLALTGAQAWRQPGESGPNCEIRPREADGQANSKDSDPRNIGGGSCTALDRGHDNKSGGSEGHKRLDNGLTPRLPRLGAHHDMIMAQVAATRQKHQAALSAAPAHAGLPSELRGHIALKGGVVAETRRKFDHDLREGAVRLVREAGKPILRRRGIWGSAPGRWATG
jgi:hypothetical protein